MAAFVIPTVFKAIDKFTAPVKRMRAGMQSFSQKAGKGLARLDRNVRKLTPSLGALGKQMLSFGGAIAVSAALSSGVNAAMDYEKNMASLQAITGVTDAEMVKFGDNITKVSKETKSSSVEMAKAFELVGSAKPELLKNADALGEVTKAAVILSQASGDDLETSVKSLTGTLNQFNLGADSSKMVIDTLAAGAQAGAAAVPLISESLDKFGTVAASMNLSVQDSVGLIETLAEKNIKGAEAGTKLRNVLTKMATAKALPKEAQKQLAKFGVNLDIVSNKTLPLNDRLKELSKIQGDATALSKVFGTENLVAGQIILQNVDRVQELTDAVSKGGIAQEQAGKNTSTLSARLEQLKNRWNNLFTSNEKVTGGLKVFKSIVVFVTDNLETVVGVVGGVIGVMLTLRTIISTVTMAVKVWSAAQTVINFLLTANPIGLIIAAIAALVGVIIWLVSKIKNWGAIWDGIVGSMTARIEFFKYSVQLVWQVISHTFQTMVEGIVMAWKWGMNLIGMLSDEQFEKDKKQIEEQRKLRVAAMKETGGKAVDAFVRSHTALVEGVVTAVKGTPESEELKPVNPKLSEQQALTQRIEESQTGKLDINVNDPGNNSTIDSKNLPIGVNLSSTMGIAQ